MKLLRLYDESTFKFDCLRCGSCCTKALPFELTPYDYYKIARHVGFDSIFKYIFVNDSKFNSSYVPSGIYLKSNEFGKCFFLENDRCTIEKDKPIICKIYPLTRGFNKNEDMMEYYLMEDRCSHNTTEYTLKEWLDKYKLRESETFTRRYAEYCIGFYNITNHFRLDDNLKFLFARDFLYPYEQLTDKETFEQQIDRLYTISLFKFKRKLERIKGK